jgi:integrase
MPPKKSTRRARGTGTIFKDERRGVWVGRRPIGRSPKGHTQYQEVTAPTQQGVIARLKQLQPPDDATTVAEWSTRWLASLGNRPQTRDCYENSVRARIVPMLGHLKVKALTPFHVESAIRSMTDTGLAVGTVLLTLEHLQTMLSAAVRAGLIATNPVKAARKPRRPRTAINPFTPVELARIIASCQSPPDLGIAILASTGARIGEVIALDVEDVQGQMLSITKTMTQKHGIGPPKSPHSKRTIRIPDAAVPAVRQAIAGRKAGPLLLGPNGRQKVRGLQTAWQRFLARLGMEYRNPHQLRHSIGSALNAAGVGVADLAAYLGDTEAAIVATYLHRTDADPSKALDGLFSMRKVSAR